MKHGQSFKTMAITINGNGTVTGVSVGGLPDGIVDTDMLAAGAVTAAKKGTGSILQVVSAFSNTHLSSSSTTYVDLTGVTATITPTSSSNKILIICSIALSKENNHSFHGRIVRNGSAISGSGGATSNNQEIDGVWWNIRTAVYSANPSSVNYLDSPSTTSAVTYKAQGKTSGSSHGFSLNRTGDSGNDLYNSPGFSQITLMEVAA